MRSTIKRIVRSDLHLRKLIQVLTKFIVSDRHPEWAHHALRWLLELFRTASTKHSPSRLVSLRKCKEIKEACQPLLSYATEMSGLERLFKDAAMRGGAVCSWNKTTIATNSSSPSASGIPLINRWCYTKSSSLPSTQYVYVDGMCTLHELGVLTTQRPSVFFICLIPSGR